MPLPDRRRARKMIEIAGEHFGYDGSVLTARAPRSKTLNESRLATMAGLTMATQLSHQDVALLFDRSADMVKYAIRQTNEGRLQELRAGLLAEWRRQEARVDGR